MAVEDHGSYSVITASAFYAVKEPKENEHDDSRGSRRSTLLVRNWKEPQRVMFKRVSSRYGRDGCTLALLCLADSPTPILTPRDRALHRTANSQ
jgi:hypothetical protein